MAGRSTKNKRQIDAVEDTMSSEPIAKRKIETRARKGNATSRDEQSKSAVTTVNQDGAEIDNSPTTTNEANNQNHVCINIFRSPFHHQPGAIPKYQSSLGDSLGNTFRPIGNRNAYDLSGDEIDQLPLPADDIYYTRMVHPAAPEPPQFIDLEGPMVNKSMLKHTKGFPRFLGGDVYIELVAGNGGHSYKLHSKVLRKYSVFFLEHDDLHFQDLDEGVCTMLANSTNVRQRYELSTYDPQRKTHILARSFLVQSKAPVPDKFAVQLTSTLVPVPSNETLKAYENLFRMLYGQEPDISTEDFSLAVAQVDCIMQLALAYGCRLKVIPYLREALEQFSGDLYHAIIEDPPRWARISMFLESSAIYKESMIHLMGLYMDPAESVWKPISVVPWNTGTEVMALVQHKVDRLVELQGRIEREIFAFAEELDKEHVLLDLKDIPTTFDRWFTVQLFKNWLERALGQVSKPKKPFTATKAKVFQTIDTGGDAYLTMAEVLEAFDELRPKEGMPPFDQEKVQKQLNELKNLAKSKAAPLLVNKSKVSPRKMGVKYFPYLTCLEMEDSEIPWNSWVIFREEVAAEGCFLPCHCTHERAAKNTLPIFALH